MKVQTNLKAGVRRSASVLDEMNA